MNQQKQPLEVYQELLSERKLTAEQLAGKNRIISISRGITAGAGAIIFWLSAGRNLFPPAWLLLPALTFVALAVWHERIIRKQRYYQAAINFFTRGIARINDEWHGTGEDGTEYLQENHPYAADLDIFGKVSLFQLLCGAQTKDGQGKLAAWLSAPASAEEIRNRQSAVAELAPLVRFREDTALSGAELKQEWKSSTLRKWSKKDAIHFSKAMHWAAMILVVVTLATAALWLTKKTTSRPFVYSLIAEFVVAFSIRKKVAAAIDGAENVAPHLQLLARLLTRFEDEDFTSPYLNRLKDDLKTGGHTASEEIANLARLADFLEWRRNQFFIPFAMVLLWETQIAFRIDQWKIRIGDNINTWIETASELEALSSFAAYHYENPEDAFPEITEGIQLEAQGITHPFLHKRNAVRNDVSLNESKRLLIISGSNMSGKSTLMRSLGVAAVMALAGAPVRAKTLRISPLIVGASIRIQDSLAAGISHFYAEIKRLRQIKDLTAGPLPLLFLLDEILHGTNSSDRLAGSQAYILSLIKEKAIGIVTTHDLALAQIAEIPETKAVNIHFVDHIEDGKIAFDYKIRPGVVQKSNALDLMRAVGLDV